MVDRLFVEKKPGFDLEARSLLSEINAFLGIASVRRLRLINRYDIEGVAPDLLDKCKTTIFSEPQFDRVGKTLDLTDAPDAMFAVESLPGQFDQRADSAAQCVQLAAQCPRPLVRTAKVYLLYGDVTESDVARVKKHVINAVDSREASFDLPRTLSVPFARPGDVAVLDGFTALDENGLQNLLRTYALAMDLADMTFCRDYFSSERRDPTLTELRMIDTYWSDHCRHTTFLTELQNVSFHHLRARKAYERYLSLRKSLGRENKPVTLMDVATVGAKYLKSVGELTDLDESEEINACTVKIDVKVNGRIEKWLLLFKNETHNHPTEIEPFGGAATCIGGAIRDPLSGRAYVYQAMRVTGAADPTRPLHDTIPGKLPQRRLVATAAAGYSAYGNQIGLATGLVDELYHDGYAAKHLEIGAVVGAAPESHVRREEPAPGDRVVLLGGRTGRDGCGGATGSSKSHTAQSLETCGAEVQKGNAPEERKLQRLFRDPRATRLIKRCNDFGAGGVSVAVGELADGLTIDLDQIPKKYDGLDGTELAISESQERMAVVLAPGDVDAFRALADAENLESAVVAEVTEQKRLVMRWRGQTIVDVSREFLSSNGARKTADAYVSAPETVLSAPASPEALAGDLNFCLKRGLSERFDATIGAGSVLMPLGGVYQTTPSQAMAALIPVPEGDTNTCSIMAYGCNPALTARDPYKGGYLATVEALSKLVASGGSVQNAHLTNQEYFERMSAAPESWGKPLAALLGSLDAQLDFSVAAIGGKDSMSGTFEDLRVPPTLCAFAVGTAEAGNILSPEFKRAGSAICLVAPEYADGLPVKESQKAVFEQIETIIRERRARAVCAVTYGGVMGALVKMSLGNRVGAEIDGETDFPFIPYGAFLLETNAENAVGTVIGRTVSEYALTLHGVKYDLAALEARMTDRLESVYPTRAGQAGRAPTYSSDKRFVKTRSFGLAAPSVLIPVFPGTNCEYDTARAFMREGARVKTVVVNNLTPQGVAQSVERFAAALRDTQILFLPGGFSGGDEPDGSAKFITAFLRNPLISDEIANLLQARGGLIGGICNGFQALVKLGLLPFGEIREPDAHAPTLTYNLIGRHQSRLARTRVCSALSPWLSLHRVGDVRLAPISHGEGRFIIEDALLAALAQNGQIAAQYVDLNDKATMDIDFNPNGSTAAIEGITSPDGRVFGRMSHCERTGTYLYKNVPGNQESLMFRGAVGYFK